MIGEIVEETAMVHMPTAWYYIPKAMKNELKLTAQKAW